MSVTLGFATFTETDVASAATCNIAAAATLLVRITGTTTITSFGTTAKRLRLIRFAGALTLTHNATSLILPGGANILTAAGDTATAASDASGNWRVTSYQRADGSALTLASSSVIQSSSSAAFVVGRQGLTNPGLQVDDSIASCVTGLYLQPQAAGNAMVLGVTSSATNEGLQVNAKGSGGISLGNVSSSPIALGQSGSGPPITLLTSNVAVVSNGAAAIGISRTGNAPFMLQVDCATASAATGVKITGAAAGSRVVLAAISSGTDEGLDINAKGAGTIQLGSAAMSIGSGVIVGAPTGSFKGAGTVNHAGDIYKNNTAYTNPKWVLKQHYAGEVDADGPYALPTDARGRKIAYCGLRSIEETEAFARENHDLPLMTLLPEAGAFGRGDLVLASLEEAYLHIFELNRRVAMLEAAPSRLRIGGASRLQRFLQAMIALLP